MSFLQNSYSKGFMNMLKRIIARIRGSLTLEELIQRGLTCGDQVNINSGCLIDEGFVHLIKLGNNVTLAPKVTVLAHDASTKNWLGYTKIGIVEIGDNVFIGTGSVILPGVKIGNNVIIGAGSVVTKEIPANSVAVGNPAKIIQSTNDYISDQKNKMDSSPLFDESYTHYNGTRKGKIVSPGKLNEQVELLKLNGGKGFVR